MRRPVTDSSRQTRLVAAIAMASLLCAAACSPADGPDDKPDATADGGTDEAPAVEIGGCDDDGKGFVDWSQSKSKPPMLRGIQGGQHIWFSVKARNVSKKKLRMAVTLIVEETTRTVIPGRVEYTSTLPEVDGWYFYEGARAYVKCPCQVVGKQLRAELEVIDLYGRTASDQVWITPTWDGSCDHDPAGSCKKQ